MKKEVKIGIYAVVILLAAWGGIRFLSGVDIFGRSATYYAYYEQVNGVQSAAPVVLRGVKIGQVTNISVSPERPTEVELTLSVQRCYKLPADSEAKIFSTSIMGGKGIEIVLGLSDKILESGATIPSGYTKDLMSSAGDELAFYKEKIGSMIDNVNKALQNVNTLLESNNRNLTEAMANLNSITAGLDGAIGRDSRSLKEIIENVNTLTATLGANSSRIDSIMVNVNTFTGALAEGNTAASLSSALSELNTTLERINAGDGTVGKLLGDEELYANLTQASANLSALLADLKEHPKRYVHFSLFGAKEKDSAKVVKKIAKANKKQAKADRQ